MVNRVARWDGLAWHPMADGIQGYFVRESAIGADGALFAGGLFSIADRFASNNIALWGDLSPSQVQLSE